MDIPKTLFATLVKQGRMEMHLTHVYPNQNKNNSTYDQILRLLNQCNDYQLQVILATTTALLDSNPFISNVDTTNDTK